MLSANVSAFSIRKAVGGGAAPVPYVLEMRIIGGGGSSNNWFWASGGAAAGGFANLTITEPAANVSYYIIVGAGAAARASGSDGNGISGGISYIMDAGSNTLATGTGGSYSSTEYYVAPSEPPQIGTSSYSGGAGVGPSGGGTTGVANPGNQHTNGYYGGDSSPMNQSIANGMQGGGGAGHGGDGGDAGNTANSAGAGGAGAAWHDGVMRGGGGGGCQIIRSYNTASGVAAGGSGGGGAGGSADYNNQTNAGNGTANTGGGSGGGGRAGTASSQTALGGAGGSGVGVVRYQGAQRGTGGTITSSGGYTYHTFTSTGYFVTA
jgi:hypothetical protein